jgi:transposase
VGLAEQVEQLQAENASLMARVQILEAELEKLRREMGRDSSNSGKPPSSDTVTERAAQGEQRLSRAERRRQAREKAKKFMAERVKRRPGKQPGTTGAALARVARPDYSVAHVPEQCRACGQSLESAEVVGTESRQVFDLPALRLEVTDHQIQSRRCGCGALTKAVFPKQASAPACYGPVVRATAVYLMVGQHLPVARAAAVLSQVCGAPVSTGWLAGLSSEAAAGLGPFLAELRAQLAAEDVLHADETGSRISGARYWFHVACNGLLTLLDCHEKRGVDALKDMAVLPFFSGVLVSDGWKPYWSIEGIEHALCCAHLLRDLASLSSSARHRAWADDMADLLVEAKNAVQGAWPRAGTVSARASCAPTVTVIRSWSTGASPPCLPTTAPAVLTVTLPTCSAGCETSATRSPATGPSPPCPLTTTRPNGTCAWPSYSKRSADASGLLPAPRRSVPCAAISRRPENTGSRYGRPRPALCRHPLVTATGRPAPITDRQDRRG